MAYLSVFKRYEIKYLISVEEKRIILESVAPYMLLDKYGHTTIRNIYFDTPDHRLIRRSIEKPVYKEKIRIRCYSEADSDTDVFVELKKKYKHIVYKRRVSLPNSAAVRWLSSEDRSPADSQISREIDYFKQIYSPLIPSVFLSYEREAYYERSGGDLRITFDESIFARETDLSLSSPLGGSRILDEDLCVMEIKCSGGMPLWLVHVLSENKIYKSSFSKYGEAYKKLIFPREHRRAYENKREILR